MHGEGGVLEEHVKPPLRRIEEGQIDSSCIISQRITLDEVLEMYNIRPRQPKMCLGKRGLEGLIACLSRD